MNEKLRVGILGATGMVGHSDAGRCQKTDR